MRKREREKERKREREKERKREREKKRKREKEKKRKIRIVINWLAPSSPSSSSRIVRPPKEDLYFSNNNCRFFASTSGCRVGQNCKFKHIVPSQWQTKGHDEGHEDQQETYDNSVQ